MKKIINLFGKKTQFGTKLYVKPSKKNGGMLVSSGIGSLSYINL